MKISDMTTSPRRTWPGTLTLAGITLGLLLAILAAWADYESTAYGFMRRAQTPFRGLVCPVFIGQEESSTITVKVSNSTDRALSPVIRTEVSTPEEVDPKRDSLTLASGESDLVQRTIGPQNVDLGSFIFVYALVYSAYPLPPQENTCGVFVLPVKDGGWALIIGTSLSILCMAVGMFLLYKQGMPARPPGSLIFMVIATVFALAFGYAGLWMQAGILIVVLILTLVITIGNSVRQ